MKNIAGLVKKLTYREMNDFASIVASRCPNEGPDTLIEALLDAADDILENKETPRLG